MNQSMIAYFLGHNWVKPIYEEGERRAIDDWKPLLTTAIIMAAKVPFLKRSIKSTLGAIPLHLTDKSLLEWLTDYWFK